MDAAQPLTQTADTTLGLVSPQFPLSAASSSTAETAPPATSPAHATSAEGEQLPGSNTSVGRTPSELLDGRFASSNGNNLDSLAPAQADLDPVVLRRSSRAKQPPAQLADYDCNTVWISKAHSSTPLQFSESSGKSLYSLNHFVN